MTPRALVLLACLAAAGCGPRARSFLTPVPAESFDFALRAYKTYCFTTENGLDVFVIGPTACPLRGEVEAVEVDTLDKARATPEAIRGAVAIITPFVLRCAGQVVRGCSQGDIVVVWEKSWKQRTLRHELGHVILGRTRDNGDAPHAYRVFWSRLEGRW